VSKISIVIPAYNEAENIGACLEALVRQTTAEPFEVIVVDNGSTDRTAGIAREFQDRLSLRVVPEPRKGRGAARATGCRLADGEIIFCTDADTCVPPRWIETFSDVLRAHPDFAGVTGTSRINDCTPYRNWVFNTFMPLAIRANYLIYRHAGLSGFSCAFRKDAYEKCGGFDPQADAYEDLELSTRMSKYGHITFCTQAPVLFSGRRFRGGLIKGCYEYTKTYVEKFFLGKRRVLLSNVK
jgi:glycosyltransferase involved in cell wall biosynthesis